MAKERKDEDLVDLDPKRHQKEKKTQELNQALKVMGIRPSTFNAWVIADRPDKVIKDSSSTVINPKPILTIGKGASGRGSRPEN